ncbi:MAG: L-ribulose-5-phosphate 3-epimerase [Chloroflexota bacterium]
MNNPKGLYEKALPEAWSWDHKLSEAGEIGFDFLEISIDHTPQRFSRLDWSGAQKAELRSAIAQSGVMIFNIVLSAHRTWPFGSDSLLTRQKAAEIARKAIDLAVSIGIRTIQIAGYFVFDEPHTPKSRDYFVAGLSKAADYAAQAGVMLGLENMDGEDVLSLETALELVQELNNPWFKLYPDVGNLAANQLDPCHQLRLAAGQLVGMHLKETKIDVYRRVPFGQGVVPFKDVARTLNEINYQGPLTLEMWSDNVDDSVDIAMQSLKWMKEQFN